MSVLFIYRRLIAGWVIADGDLATYFYPYWVAVSRSLRSGQLPLWNPYLFAGVPLLANSQAGVFYPLNWPFWLLGGSTLISVVSAIHSSVLLHVCLAGFSAYCLGRSLQFSPWAAAIAGLIYAGGGFIGIHIEHLNQLQALAWMPFVFLVTGKKSTDLRFPSPISVIAMAMILLAGHTQMAFITSVAVVIWHTGYVVSFRFSRLKQLFSNRKELKHVPAFCLCLSSAGASFSCRLLSQRVWRLYNCCRHWNLSISPRVRADWTGGKR